MKFHFISSYSSVTSFTIIFWHDTRDTSLHKLKYFIANERIFSICFKDFSDNFIHIYGRINFGQFYDMLVFAE